MASRRRTVLPKLTKAERAYFKTSRQVSRALAKGFREQGRLPKNRADARKMSRLDWPWTEYNTAFARLERAIKHVADGNARHPVKKNDELFARMLKDFPDLLDATPTRARVASYQKWLLSHGERWKDDGAIARAIYRARPSKHRLRRK
jgi:hypothetical protein